MRSNLQQTVKLAGPYQIEEAEIVSYDPRDPRSMTVRMYGSGTVIRKCTGMTANLKSGMRVLAVVNRYRHGVVVLGALQDADYVAANGSTVKSLHPPSNLVTIEGIGFLVAQWDFYPGNSEICYQVQHNLTNSEDGNETSVLITKGSQYIMDAAPGVTHYFRVRALQWISENNIMYSAWSVWVSGEAETVPLHHASHEYGGLDQVDIDWRQILSLRITALTGFFVEVMSGLLARSGPDLVVAQQSLDLSANVPGSGALYCLISVNSSGTLTATNGTAVANLGALALTDIPDTPSGNFRLAAVQLYYGQTGIIEDNIKDLRWPQEKLASLIGVPDIDFPQLRIVAAVGGDYDNVQEAITELAGLGGGVVLIMPGGYTSTTINLAASVYITTWGNVELNTASGPVLLLPASGGIRIEEVQLKSTGGGPAISFPSGSTAILRLLSCRIVHISGSYAIDASVADPSAALSLIDSFVEFASGGIHTKAVLNLNRTEIAGNVIQAASAGALTIDGGHIYGALTITTTAACYGAPRIDGVVTGVPAGYYVNSSGKIVPGVPSLSDVAITGIADGDILQYVLANARWENKAPREQFVVMETGVTPPNPLISSDGTDWIYTSRYR